MTNEEAGIKIGTGLLNSCTPLSEALDQTGLNSALMDDRDFCFGLDATAMLCETCSWWCEPSELDDDCNCEDCRN